MKDLEALRIVMSFISDHEGYMKPIKERRKQLKAIKQTKARYAALTSCFTISTSPPT
jgi:hypothetical protein